MTPRSLSVDLVLDVTAPYAARTLACTALQQWGLRSDDVLAATSLVVTELVTNALAHGGVHEPAVLELHLHRDRLRVAVADCGVGLPRQRDPDETDEGGRGMLLVAQLCDDWGVEPWANGKRVYAVVALDAERGR